MSNRAFDTNKLGSGYGFESFPDRRVEMPPTWAIATGGMFLVGALLMWVCLRLLMLYATRANLRVTSRFIWL
jgi:dolichyl-phosphate beta-glucosyltransferase